MGAVTILNVNEQNATIEGTVRIVRTDRVGLFPGFCEENFPYILTQVGDFTGEQFIS